MFGRESAELAKKYLETLKKRAIENRSIRSGETSTTERAFCLPPLRNDLSSLEQSSSTQAHEEPEECARRRSENSHDTFQFAVDVPPRHQACIPPVGSLHACCTYSEIFTSVTTHALFRNLTNVSLRTARTRMETGRREVFDGSVQDGYAASSGTMLPGLRAALDSLEFAKYSVDETETHERTFDGVMSGYRDMISSEEFVQLSDFIFRFSTLLKTSFMSNLGYAALHDDSFINQYFGKRRRLNKNGAGRHRDGRLELFQKMILMHATYFAASITLSDESTERIDRYLSTIFDTSLFTLDSLQHFKQRATVFLVPRRHGKTWFLVPLISLLVSSFERIRIGYTAHLRKATKPVFEEIYDRLCSWYGDSRVQQIKGETISFAFKNGSRSSIVFASSQNTNVSVFYYFIF